MSKKEENDFFINQYAVILISVYLLLFLY